MNALTINTGTVRSIYAAAAKLGMVGRDNQEDALHILVEGLTGKASIKELTLAEGQCILDELHKRSSPASARPKAKRKYIELPGGVTEAQQRLIWRLMFQLQEFDQEPDETPLRNRLCGIIARQIGVTAFPADPFRFMEVEDGGRLIDILKHYAETAELKYLHSARYREASRK